MLEQVDALPLTQQQCPMSHRHGQMRLRNAHERAQWRHLRVECVGLGARAIQVERAGLAFALAAGDARRCLALRVGQRLHDAKLLLRTAQHEILPRHFAGDQQSRAVYPGR